MTTTKERKAPKRKPVTDDLAAEIQSLLSESEELRAADAELDRLRIEQAKVQHQFDQLAEKLRDTDELVSRIEAGEEISADDSGERLANLRRQLEAFAIAIQRAEKARQTVLDDLSGRIAQELIPKHNRTLTELSNALEAVCLAAGALDRIPAALRRHGLKADPSRYPRFYESELLQMRGRLRTIAQPMLDHLKKGAE